MEPALKNWLQVGLLGMIWGSSFMAVSVAVQSVGPLMVAGSRLAVAAALLLILTRIMGIGLPGFRRPSDRKLWFYILGFACFSMAFPFTLLSWGQKYVTSGFAGVTMAAVPLLVLPLAHIFVPGDRMTVLKSIGMALGFVGVWILIGPGAFESHGGSLEPLARAACLTAAACYAIGGVVTRLAPPVDPIALATGATGLAALMLLPVALMVEGLPADAPPLAVLSAVYLGAVPTAGANLLLVAVIRSAGPTFLSLVNYQVPVWSVIFGVVFLNELLPPAIFIALALILAGAAVSQWVNLSRILRKPA